MNDPAVQPPLSALRSKADFEAALQWSLRHALAARARRMVWVDTDFAAWPLDDPALLETLTAWLQLPQRRLLLLAHHFSWVERQRPRFGAWRRTWSHAIEAWTPSEGVEAKLPLLVIDDKQLCLQVFDIEQWRGRLSLDERKVGQWRDEIDVLLQRCEAAYPVQHLGL